MGMRHQFEDTSMAKSIFYPKKKKETKKKKEKKL